jgi:hypothetical protein
MTFKPSKLETEPLVAAHVCADIQIDATNAGFDGLGPERLGLTCSTFMPASMTRLDHRFECDASAYGAYQGRHTTS